jgi:hypothetical protein
LSDVVVNVRCACPMEVAAARFFARGRHGGHLDVESTCAEVLASLQAQARLGHLEIVPAVEVDTCAEVDVQTLVGDIQALFIRCRTSRLASGGIRFPEREPLN